MSYAERISKKDELEKLISHWHVVAELRETQGSVKLETFLEKAKRHLIKLGASLKDFEKSE